MSEIGPPHHTWRSVAVLLGIALSLSSQLANSRGTLEVSSEFAAELGHRIWQREGNGRYDSLTWWNDGEEFASLGIGHFIWYPTDMEGPYQESFPDLLQFLAESNVELPSWLSWPDVDCPWSNRAEFFSGFYSDRMQGLRKLLAETVNEQSLFLILRLKSSLPRMLDIVPKHRRGIITRRFEALVASPEGIYALVDYVNFKGEGVIESERYAGKGWGLLQVLDEMNDHSDLTPVQAFVVSAAYVLRRRVENAPVERQEDRWLAGWLKRLRSYEGT